MEIRNSSISVLTAANKLPKNIRPKQNDLYHFFYGRREKLSAAQRRRIADEITRDYNEIIEYLND